MNAYWTYEIFKMDDLVVLRVKEYTPGHPEYKEPIYDFAMPASKALEISEMLQKCVNGMPVEYREK